MPYPSWSIPGSGQSQREVSFIRKGFGIKPNLRIPERKDKSKENTHHNSNDAADVGNQTMLALQYY